MASGSEEAEGAYGYYVSTSCRAQPFDPTPFQCSLSGLSKDIFDPSEKITYRIVTTLKQMNRSDTLLESVQNFYSQDTKNAEYLRDILEKRKGISLRNLEWFITNYSKKTNLSYTTTEGKSFTVHCAYKSSLDGYSKKLFDPFCRTDKIEFNIPGTETQIQTTVAQLNFIRWCIKNNIIDYIVKNREQLLSRKEKA